MTVIMTRLKEEEKPCSFFRTGLSHIHPRDDKHDLIVWLWPEIETVIARES